MSNSKRYAIYALLVIFFANFLSYCDRLIVSGLESELTQAFSLSAVEFAGLWTMFTIGYMVFAPIVGFLADRYSRTRIFAVCVFVWSLATISSGLAQSKSTLEWSRFFIGIGEAGCLVLGPTLIADFFTKEVRGLAMSVFFLGLPLGGAAGFIVAALTTTTTFSSWLAGFAPGAAVSSWRVAFMLAGAPGLVLAVFIGQLVDPPRGGETESVNGHIHGIKPYIELLKNRTLLLIILAQAAAVIILVPLLHFGVHFFESKHEMNKREATLTLSIITLGAGMLGIWLSGIIGDRLARRVKGAYSLLAAFGFLFGMPWFLLGFTTQPKWLVLPALATGAFCYFLCMPAVNTQIANAVSPKQRAMAFALAVFILHLLGDTLAPVFFAGVIELLAHRYEALGVRHVNVQARQSAFVMFSFFMLLAGLCCLAAAMYARRDEERAQQQAETSDPDAPTQAESEDSI
jgi:MFS family permease